MWYPPMAVMRMGKRTSVYLSDDLEAAVDKTGLPLAELIRRGVYGPLASPAAIPDAASATGVVVPADAPLRQRCERCAWVNQAAGSHCEQCGAQIGRVLR